MGGFACGSDEYDAWQLMKNNLETGQACCFRERDSCCYSEPVFVADPNGKHEDSGVLLSVRLDGWKAQSSLLMINARCKNHGKSGRSRY